MALIIIVQMKIAYTDFGKANFFGVLFILKYKEINY